MKDAVKEVATSVLVILFVTILFVGFVLNPLGRLLSCELHILSNLCPESIIFPGGKYMRDFPLGFSVDPAIWYFEAFTTLLLVPVLVYSLQLLLTTVLGFKRGWF